MANWTLDTIYRLAELLCGFRVSRQQHACNRLKTFSTLPDSLEQFKPDDGTQV